MTDEQWANAWRVFQSVQSLPVNQRNEALRAADLESDLLNEVSALLELSAHSARDSRSSPFSTPKQPVSRLMPGDEVDRYTIIGAIGEGGFGRVYSARDRVLQRNVAIKILHRAVARSSEDALEESRTASALNHPNILTIYETLEEGDRVAIVTELVQGDSLRQLLAGRDAPLPLEEAIAIARQIAAALQEAHAAGITHRDVKPENVLLRRKDSLVKLVDFGLARGNGSGRGSDLAGDPFNGTMRYLAPEQIAGQAATPASDVFALGLTLYELVAGVHPFRRDSPIDSALAIAAASAAPPSKYARGIPKELDRLILAALEKDPALRPTAATIAQRLATFGDARRPRISRPRRLVLLAALGSVVLVLAWRGLSRPGKLQMHLQSRLLTGQPGRESLPALSPDGRYVVYQSRPSKAEIEQTILRDTETEQFTTLTIRAPFAWLPDGQRIGFLRHLGQIDKICSVRRDGSGEHCTVEGRNIGLFAWSPDGEFLVYAAGLGNTRQRVLFRYSLRDRSTAQITFPPPDSNGDNSLAISADGRLVAFRRTLALATSDVYVTSLRQPGTLRQVSFDRSEGGNLAWLPDGSGLIASTMRGAHFSLWLHDLRSKAEPLRLTEVGLEAFSVSAALTRNRIAWTNNMDDSNIWRVRVSGGGAERFLGSTTRERDVAWSSKGLIAYRSDRSSYPEIWIARDNGRDERKATNLRAFTGSPRWSPDGPTLVFDSQKPHAGSDVYLMQCNPETLECGQPVQLTDHPANDSVPNWSADGKYIYFGSQRSGMWQIWRIPAHPGQPAVQITSAGGLSAAESSDGKWLYYSRIDSPAGTGVWRIPINQGKPGLATLDPGTLVVPMGFRATATWILRNDDIFFSQIEPGATRPEGIWVHHLPSGEERLVHPAGGVGLNRGLALSPDGRWILYSQTDNADSNVVIADYETAR
ncbi:MAG: protein kinase [Acidobacteriota bacterium]|nr:protein kinase [Acidobacteriota bacterium]